MLDPLELELIVSPNVGAGSQTQVLCKLIISKLSVQHPEPHVVSCPSCPLNSQYIAKDELEHLILLPLPLKSWDCYPHPSLRPLPSYQNVTFSQTYCKNNSLVCFLASNSSADICLISKVFGPG